MKGKLQKKGEVMKKRQMKNHLSLDVKPFADKSSLKAGMVMVLVVRVLMLMPIVTVIVLVIDEAAITKENEMEWKKG